MPKKPAILIVDDEEKLCRYLKKEFLRKGYAAYEAQCKKDALEILGNELVDVVLLDIVLQDENGLDVLREVRRDYPSVHVIMLTGNATVETAIESMKLGAYDYLTKPYNTEELCLLIDRAYEEACMRRENEFLRFELSRQTQFKELIGQDRETRELKSIVKKVARTNSAVLISGETGTGKELVAQMIHHESLHCDGPFVALNCAAFQESLLESELFGHEKGAFTDAIRQKQGLIEIADNGTLFLDEIGSMSPGVQAKVLRFLDSGGYRRVGGVKNLKTSARIISATNQNLAKAIQEGKFREDLFYRLNVVNIKVPPLRNRKSDVPLLVDHFLRKCRALQTRGEKRISRKALEALVEYHWPGNVRELENVIERAVIMAEGEMIEPVDVWLPGTAGTGEFPPQNTSLAEIERVHILKVLAESGGNKTKAAGALEIDIKTLYNKLKEYTSLQHVQTAGDEHGT